MKIMLISGDQMTASRVHRYFTPAGYGFIHYTNPLKAMDNFKEIRPDAVLFHESEFPRHWKMAVKFLRDLYSRDSSLFILLVSSLFTEEDVHKAHFLGVNALLPFDEPMKTLESMILRYKVAPDVRKNHQLVPVGETKLDFMFMNPNNLQLVNSHILELSMNGAVLKVDEPFKAAGLSEGSILKNCSLKTGKSIVNLNVKIEHTGAIFEITFLEGSENWQNEVQVSLEALQ